MLKLLAPGFHILESMYMTCGFSDCTMSAMDDVKPVTHLLAVDVTSKKGIKLLREGIHFLVIKFLDCMLH